MIEIKITKAKLVTSEGDDYLEVSWEGQHGDYKLSSSFRTRIRPEELDNFEQSLFRTLYAELKEAKRNSEELRRKAEEKEMLKKFVTGLEGKKVDPSVILAEELE